MTTHTRGTREGWFARAALGTADWLRFAAAPTFAIMALLTGVLGGGPRDMLCSAAQDASPLSGMVSMYMLMSAFHAAPWLKLISSRRRRGPRGPSYAWGRYLADVHGTTVRPWHSTASMGSEG
jgi:hypothetical protein